MSDRYIGRIDYRVPRLPDAAAEVNLFVVVEELLIESAQLLKQVTTEQDTTATLPIHEPLGIALPTPIVVREEKVRELRKRAEIECRNQITPDRRERARRLLIRAISIAHLAPKSPRFRMTIRESYPLIQSPIMDNRVWV